MPSIDRSNQGEYEDKEILSTDGQSLADSLGCGFVDVSGSDGRPR